MRMERCLIPQKDAFHGHCCNVNIYALMTKLLLHNIADTQ